MATKRRRSPEVEAAATEMVGLLDSEFLRALAEPARREVLRVLLLDGPSRVMDLADQLPQDRSVISRHLRVLEAAGIVTSVWKGRERIYSLDGQGFVGTLERMVARARAQMALCCPPPSRGAEAVRPPWRSATSRASTGLAAAQRDLAPTAPSMRQRAARGLIAWSDYRAVRAAGTTNVYAPCSSASPSARS